MSKVTISAELFALLIARKERAEIYGPDGQFLGYVTPRSVLAGDAESDVPAIVERRE